MATPKPPAIAFEDDELQAVIAGLVMLDRYADAALARIAAILPYGAQGAGATASSALAPTGRSDRSGWVYSMA